MLKGLYLFLVLIIVFGIGCGDSSVNRKSNSLVLPTGKISYVNDSRLSDSVGIPTSAAVFYLPPNTVADILRWQCSDTRDREYFLKMRYPRDSIIRLRAVLDSMINDSLSLVVDTFLLKWYSKDLYSLDVPILYNYFSGSAKYRLSYFHGLMYYPDFTITINELSGNYVAEIRIQPENSNKMVVHSKSIPPDSVSRLIGLFNSIDYEKTPYWKSSNVTDVAELLIEIHKPDGYFYMNRDNATDDSLFIHIMKEYQRLFQAELDRLAEQS